MSGILRLSNDATGQSTLDTNATNDVTYSLPDTTGDTAALILTDNAHQVASINWDGIDVTIQNGDINLDNGTLFIDEDNDLVGIGTTSPEQKLHVSDGGLAVETAVNAALTVGQDVDGSGTNHLGIYYGTAVDATASADVFTSNGDLRIRVDGNGSASGGQIRFHHGFSENVGTIQLDPANGSATFSGDVRASNGDSQIWLRQNVGGNSNRPMLLIEGDSGSNNILEIYEGGLTAEDRRISFTNNGSASFTGDVETKSLNGGPLAGFRNLIINGGFNVWQRGNSVNITGGGSEYTADRWLALDSANQEVVINDDPNCPSGLGITIPNAGTFLYTPLELPAAGRAGPFKGQYTLSFYSTHPISTNSTSYMAEFRDTAISSSNRVQLTVPAFEQTGELLGTFIRYATTINIDSPPNNSNLCLILGVTTATANQTFTSFQFEIGNEATPFEHRPYGTELALCQRYYQTLSLLWLYQAETAAGPQYRVGVPRTVSMRANPTITVGSFNGLTNAGAISDSKSWRVDAQSASGDNSLATNLTAEAEL